MNYSEELEIKVIVAHALKEDIGLKDITTETLIPAKINVKAVLLAKEDCVVCGMGVVAMVFKSLDKNIEFKSLVSDGKFVKKGRVIARIRGKAKSILSSERVALNFLSFLSGISTGTRKFVNAVKPYKVKILDTRKTIPGLRLLEKYAVRIGGGYNHRLRLDEMFMVKDNHIAVAKQIQTEEKKLLRIVDTIKKKTLHARRIEIEVKDLKEFKEVLAANPDIIMLDNMPVNEIRKAVKLRNTLSAKANRRPFPILEASGGINLGNIKKIAACGVDTISVGALTHSVSSVDISLEIL
ncbi:MAG: carboxylating nicotinate-nucleotide diphosphorylase [Candidatus Omnitrophica bacterium]|nr:carboxylating nicotinate-nucleotide diphosphorylase [Candidatus Omnitrophota bacterium]